VKRTINIILSAGLLLFSACQAKKSLRIAPDKLEQKNITEKLQACICIDTTQKQAEKGVQFSIRITNDSSGAISIKNPMHIFVPNLLDDLHRRVMFPYMPRTIVDNKGGKYTFKSFEITSIKVNGRKAQDDLTEKDDILIPGKASYEIFFSVTKTIKPGTKPLEIIPVPKGHYWLQIRAHLLVNQESYFAVAFNDISIHYQ
jgi:hypothetical protein